MDDVKCLDQRTFKMLKETIGYAEDLAQALIKLNVKIPQAMIEDCDLFISFFHRFLSYANNNMRPSQETQSNVMNPQSSTAGSFKMSSFSGLQLVESKVDETISSGCNSKSGITSESSGEARKRTFDSSPNDSSAQGPHTTANDSSIRKSVAKPDESIPELYSSYIEAILSGVINSKCIGVYCQPCNMVVTKGKAWTNHSQYKNHNINVSLNRIDEMKLYECSKCKILVFGSEALADTFFDYHSQVSFSSGTRGCFGSIKMTIDQSELDFTSCSSVSSESMSNETRL